MSLFALILRPIEAAGWKSLPLALSSGFALGFVLAPACPLNPKSPVGPWKNGPKNSRLSFRKSYFIPSAHILLADNDRQHREVGVASELSGLPREKSLGGSLDEFVEPGFWAVLSDDGALAYLPRT
jgi:hypothetical protein